LYLGVSVTATAQIATYQLSLRDSTLNILYVGVSNRVAITNLPANTRVKFENEFLTPYNNIYNLTPRKPGNSALCVYNKTNKIIFSKEYTTRYSSGVPLQVGIVKYPVASVSDILVKPALVCYTGDSLKPWCRIVSYDMMLCTNDTVETKSLSGDNLTNIPFDKDIQDKIAMMKNGDRIFIENVKAIGPDKTMRTLVTIPITIAFTITDTAVSSPYNRKFRDELRVVLDAMVVSNSVKSKGGGLLEKLQEVATDSELAELTDHENTAVKNYAFLALTSRKSMDPFPILMKHFNDTDRVNTRSVDVGISWPTNEYLLLNVYPTGRHSDKYKLNETQQATVDSIMLFDSTNKIGVRDLMLRYMKPEQRFYDRVREIALSGKQPIAVLILAKYKNKQDVDLVKRSFEKDEFYAVCAAREFPHPAFYPLLTKMFKKEWAKLEPYSEYGKWGVLCEALAKYPSAETRRLFEKITTFKGEYDYLQLKHSLLVAITKFPNPEFEPLKKKIKLDESYKYGMKDDIERVTW
jgi:hypothetical protein